MDIGQFFDVELFWRFLAAMIALLNPLYGIPIFLGLTEGYTRPERRQAAFVASATVTITALASVLVGEEILAVFGIDIPSFRIAGGIIILGIGLSMLNAAAPPQGDRDAATLAKGAKRGIAVVPLAIPLTIGPGTIATAIVFSHEASNATELATLVPVVLLVSGFVTLGLLFAEPISRVLGASVISVITRIMAIILAAVAVEMMISGAVDAINTHYPHLAPPPPG